MLRLLVLSFFPAFTPPKSGGEQRLFNIYEQLANSCSVTLLSSSHPGDDESVIYHSAGFKERRIGKDDAFHTWWSRLSTARGDGDISGPCVALSGKHPTAFHYAYLEEYAAADIIVHESPFTLPFDLFFGFDAKPRVYNSYNVESALYGQMHAASTTSSQLIRDLVWDLERRLALGADLVCACSEGDRELFKESYGLSADPLLLPNGFTPTHTDRPFRGKIQSAVFLGSGHRPNVLAAIHLAEVVAAEVESLTFHFIGDCLPAGNYRPNVIRHGRVDARTKSKILEEADVALNPMELGGGSSLKVLEYIDAGLPLISTEFGVRGFDLRNEAQYIRANGETIAETIRKWRERPRELHDIAASARSVALEKFSWTAISARFRGELDSLLRPPLRNSREYIVALNDYPSFRSNGGGGRRTQGLYRQLAKDFRIFFVNLTDSDELISEEVPGGILEIHVPKTLAHSERQKELDSSFHVSAADIISGEFVMENSFLRRIYECLRVDAKLVIVEHPYMVRLPAAYSDRFVYSSQNNELALKRQSLQYHPASTYLLGVLAELEDLAVSTSAAVIAVSAEDAESFTIGRCAAAPIVIVPNGAPCPAPSTNEDDARVRRSANPAALFVGSAHMPNIEAVEFISTVLAKECPEIDFHLVGAAGESAPRPRPGNVIVWGSVSDGLKTAIANSSTVAINPMFSGGGSNVKVADFLANGLHIVSSAFGMRGYPTEMLGEVSVAERHTFASLLREAVTAEGVDAPAAKDRRRLLFDTYLSDVRMGQLFTETIRDLLRPKKRVLAVTYRYTWPVLGGAEGHFLELLRALGESGDYTVDVVAPEISEIVDTHRFHSTYAWNSALAAPTGLCNVRYRRFAPTQPPDKDRVLSPWHVQAEFERLRYGNRIEFSKDGLLWGWHPPEQWSGNTIRWASISVGIHVTKVSEIRIEGYAPIPCSILVKDELGHQLAFEEINGEFTLDFRGHGAIALQTSSTASVGADPRPLGFAARAISADGAPIDLDEPILPLDATVKYGEEYKRLHRAAMSTRVAKDIRLTDVRGPHSSALEEYVRDTATEYDLIITHNAVFRPAVVAIEAAKKNRIPSILIAQVHLDDDYYHFPDVYDSIADATAALVAPMSAHEFVQNHIKPEVVFHTPGFHAHDGRPALGRIDSAIPVGKPFVLVLGRKAHAKNYKLVIDALRGQDDVRVVLIGPDDDGVPIIDEHVVYLGLQSREVVADALNECIALVNMSSSESFGMVLLEAWAAGKPVIANASCQAFRDIVVDGKNGLLVDPRRPEALGEAVDVLHRDPLLRHAMGAVGQEIAKKYSWSHICSDFVALCRGLRKGD